MRTRYRTAAAIAALTLTAAACGGAPDAGAPAAADCAPGQIDGDLRLYNWSDYMDPELITDFEAEYGVRVVQDFFTSNEELQARVAAGGAQYDVVVPSDYMVALLIEDDLLLPLTRAAVPNIVNVASEFVDPPYDPGLVFTVPYLWGTTGLGVNVALVGDVEPSWALVFDPAIASQLPGRIALLDDARETMGAALRWLGHDPNTTDEDELRAASEVIATAREWTAAYASEGETPSLLVSGEVVVALGYSGNLLDAFDGDERFEYVVPSEGATIWTDNMAVLAEAPHPCTAHTFIDFVLRPEQHARLTNYIYYPSPNALAEEFIDAEILSDPAVYPDAVTLERLSFLRDTGDSETLFSDLFERAKR
jgi:spermidine/putrescine transport system substrate-binding protein